MKDKKRTAEGDRIAGTKKQRRKKFEKWISMEMLHRAKKSSAPVGGGGKSEPKVMSNADRRRLEIEQDPELSDFITEK